MMMFLVEIPPRGKMDILADLVDRSVSFESIVC